MDPREVLRDTIRASDIDIDPDWPRFRSILSPVTFSAKNTIFSAAGVADRVLFVTSGIAASEQVHPDGSSGIARFFGPGQAATNLTSAWRRDLAEDTLFAVTAVEGATLPLDIFNQEYLGGAAFGLYLRKLVLATLVFDKEVIAAKTQTASEVRYRFLEEFHPEDLERIPDKEVARFMGITPQGLSRFLRHRAKHT